MIAENVQTELSRLNRRRLTPALPGEVGLPDLAAQRAELAFLESERAAVRDQASRAPHESTAFLGWLAELRLHGPGQFDPLFPWLAEHATLEQMCWFLHQEVAGEAGFEDLVALTQLRMPERAKLELARNYWDELGRGHAGGMHGPMLARLAEQLRLSRRAEPIVPEAIALGNLLAGLAANRGYAYHSVGALGAVELTAPDRAALVNEGLRRLGIDGAARQYYALHATLDVKHSEAWNSEVIAPLVDGRPEIATAIAEGALMRLAAGARCFARYRAELGVG
jgi:hypothetical protein